MLSISPENTPPRMLILGLKSPKNNRTAKGSAFRSLISPELTAVALILD